MSLLDRWREFFWDLVAAVILTAMAYFILVGAFVL